MVDLVSYDDETIFWDQFQQGTVQRQQTQEINTVLAWMFVAIYPKKHIPRNLKDERHQRLTTTQVTTPATQKHHARWIHCYLRI